MNAASIDIDGLEELDRRMKLYPKTAKAALRKGTRAGAKVVQAKLKSVTPVDTGAARRAIKVRALKRSRKRVGATARYERPPGANVLYIMVLNYGSKKRNLTGTRFVNRAAEEIKPAATREAIAVASAELEKF